MSKKVIINQLVEALAESAALIEENMQFFATSSDYKSMTRKERRLLRKIRHATAIAKAVA